MTLNKRSKLLASVGSMVLLGATAASGMSGTSASASSFFNGRHLHAHLNPLNNSGVGGNADVNWRVKRAHVDIDAYSLLRNMPHAQHIHFGATARHECPQAFDDSDNDHRLSTTEGAPAYGPIRKSLTLRGDTSPASGLAVDRFPTAAKGVEHYDRTMFFGNAALRRAIKSGKGVLVIHGVDYNGNGKYDFAGAGKSELDKTLPAEATDPATCGVLRIAK